MQERTMTNKEIKDFLKQKGAIDFINSHEKEISSAEWRNIFLDIIFDYRLFELNERNENILKEILRINLGIDIPE